MHELDFDQIARQLLRALRGKRSQVALSRRLGFRSNVASKWESGQRMPTALEVLEYSLRLGVDPKPALRSLNPNAAPALGDATLPDLATWLKLLKGTQLLTTLAERSDLSRYSVGRILSGQSQPRLPEFLSLVNAMTDRVEDLIDAWVGIANVPLLEPRFVRSRAARNAIFQRPLCLAVLCLLDTRALDVPKPEQLQRLGTTLDCSEEVVRDCVNTLSAGGVIRFSSDRYVLTGSLTVDAHATPALELAAKRYWTQTAHERTRDPKPLDVCSYNVFSIARKDFTKLRELQREFYRGARALVAASEPTDLAGLLLVQLVAWDPEGAQS